MIDAARLTDAVAGQLADIFSTDIDFHEDVRSGDRFAVVYEVVYDGGEPVSLGRVLAAQRTVSIERRENAAVCLPAVTLRQNR